MTKKLFTLLLAVAVGVGTMLAEKVQIGDLYYNLDATNQTAEVARNSSAYGDIIIPSSVTYNSVSYSVTSIGYSAFNSCISLTSVTIGNSVTSIGENAFYGCISLTSVMIPNSVTSIGERAFHECRGLTSVTIPNSVTSIGNQAFWDCTDLISVTIPNSVTSIGDKTFYGCSGLTSVTIGNSVTSIGEFAFYNCYSLTSVTIGNSVTSIGNSAFAECTGLTSVTIPNSVTSIGQSAFDGCSGLTSVTIPNSVTSIGNYAFNNCTSLTSVTIGNSVTEIGNYAFYNCTSLTSVTIGNSVTSIGERAFYNCTGLTAVHISDLNAWCKIQFPQSYSSPLYYAHNLYLNGKLVTDLVIPEGITTLGDRCFYGCTHLISATIPDGVTSIGANYFADCTGLTSVTIGSGLTSMAKEVFMNCSALTSITCGAITPPTLNSSVFGGVDKSIPLYVPAQSIDLYKAAYQWKNFTNILPIEETPGTCITASGTCGDNLTWELSCDSVLTISGTGEMLDWERDNHASWYDFQNAIKDVVLLENVTSIGEYAFSGCTSMTTVTIPSTIIQIRQSAFEDCSSLKGMYISNLKAWCNVQIEGDNSNPLVYAKHLFLNGEEIVDVVIPNGITSLRGTFYGCEGIKSVQFPKGFTNIGWSTFRNTGLSNFEIPEGIDTIGDAAFYGCKSLRSITLPTTLKLIDRFAFSSSSLTSIEIPNSVISVKPLVFYLCKELTSINVVADNPYYSSLDGVLLNKDQTTLALYPSGKQGAYTIPSSVTHIGDHAFNACSGLTSLTCDDTTPPTCESTAFININTSIPLYVPAGSVSAYQSADQWKDFTNILPIEGTPGTCITASGTCGAQGDNLTWELSCDSILTISGTGEMNNYSNNSNSRTPWYSYRSSIASAIVENGVTSIGDYAFYGGCTGLTSVTIPNSVTSIGGGAFSGCTGLASVTIPNSVTSIGNYAFDWCSGLTSVTIGNSVTSIAYRAFRGCTGLTSVTIPNSVTSIGEHAFYGCSGLTSLTIPNSVTSIGEHAFYGCSGLTSVTIPNSVTSIGGSAFSNCSGLTSVTIPNSVTSIGSSAFSGCTGLTSVTIPNSVTSIGGSAFLGCSGLTSVTIPNSVTSIGSSAFSGCSGLTSVTIPNSVTSIGESAFQNCGAITEVTIGSGLIALGKSVFNKCTAIELVHWNAINYRQQKPNQDSNCFPFYSSKDNISTFVFGDSVTYIPAYLLKDFRRLESIVITAGVTEIGEYAFFECSGLTSITCEAITPPTLGSDVFYNVNKSIPLYVPAQSVDLYKAADQWKDFTNILPIEETPGTCITASGTCGAQGDNLTWELSCDSILTISGTGEMANYSNVSSVPWYSYNSSIQYVVIGNSVTSIGYEAFRYCTGLTSVTIPNSVTSIGEYAFAYCSGLTSVTIPNSVTSIGYGAFYYCTGLTSVTIPNSVTSIGVAAFYMCTGLTSVTIPNSVTSIGRWTFEDCRGLTSVTIPNSVTSIGVAAFSGCTGLTSVTIPNSVTSIGSSAFASCTGLTSIDVASDNSNYCSVDGVLFNKDKTTLIQYPGGKQGSYTIPNSVTSIGDYAFFECSGLTSVTIPNSVTSIGEFAFSGCTSLTSVTIPNSVIFIGRYAFRNCTGLTSVTIPNSVTSIGESAFEWCTGLTSITCEAVTPPTLNSSVFGGVDKSIPLYVPAGSVSAYLSADQWKDFTNILPIEAQPADVTTTTVTPSETTADIAWPQVTGAATYTIEIKKNGELICTLTFNAQGQLISIAFNAPSRNNAPQQAQAAGFSFTVTSLDSGTTYSYTMTAKGNNGNVLKTESGTFTTTGTATGIEDVQGNNVQCTKVVHNGQVLILRGEKVYNAQGALVK